MTPEAQLLAISQIVAPHQQWEIFEDIYIGAKQPYTKMVGFKYPARRGWILCSPYLADLNAMHEAEAIFHPSHELAQSYFQHLKSVVYRTKHSGTQVEFQVINATAAQRAEAFLSTFEKWVEE